jgi:Protein of unknown function (DUF1573)
MNTNTRRTVLGCVLAATVAGTAVSSCQEPGGGHVELDGRVFDAGQVVEGQVITHKFSYSNVGTYPVELANIAPSCNCTVALPSGRHLPPNATGELVVSVDTREQSGPLRSTVSVTTDSPQQREWSVEVRAHVTPEFRPATRLVDFGVLGAGERATRYLEVQLTGVTTAGIRSVRSTDPVVEASIQRASARSVMVRLDHKAFAPPGIHYGNVVFSTASQFLKEFSVAIRGEVRGSQ